ncbi:sirohydrochlorin cobaltochelatase [Paenibacillus larvae]|uniref:sirohydrochlorin cobaltochelatase n=1 Tax=Paenibacillus larvae TaxID=1464 RepID=UPI0022806507|nr:sirohydrochlorin cobaltochelatase [Paenibacillus larvae]MCY7477424.1 sirohydrochlorin cobaltochelatase [Paenibacillus larvae]MDE5167256.1 sirohydrochlorin cobaltochelatase [Paenibacillus larvae subsp. larvae]
MKKAIVVISFGTSYPETRAKTIDACENRIREMFPDYDVFRAFTSNKIIKKLAVRDGIQIDTPEQVLKKLKDAGYTEVIIQSLHLINGEEFEKIVSQALPYRDQFARLLISKPLLDSYEDYGKAIQAIKAQSPDLAEDEALVLMGHGSGHHAFSAYACLDHMLANEPIYLGTVEGYPPLERVIEQLQAANVRKVHLMPFMLVAGDHAIHDMASDEENSWKSQFIQQGFETASYLQGLGENPLIQEQFICHIKTAIEKEAAKHG